MGKKVVWVDITERGLFMMDYKDEPLVCDICDELKQLAHINIVNRDVLCVCKECLQKFVDAFNE